MTFAFSLKIKDVPWDVYYFNKDGKAGTLAFCKRDGQFEIGLFKAGSLSEAEVRQELRRDG